MSLHQFERGAVVAELSETAVDVARKMRDDCVGCVVVTRGAVPIGIITDRDIAIRVVAEGRDPSRTLVSEITTYDPTTLPRDAGIDTAARVMRERGVRRLPIVKDDGRVIGIVTADDLTILLAKELGDIGAGLADSADSTETR